MSVLVHKEVGGRGSEGDDVNMEDADRHAK
jgi:hypothetical protein